jgi:hypothetical protein
MMLLSVDCDKLSGMFRVRLQIDRVARASVQQTGVVPHHSA